jgi:serine protease Do
LQVGEDVVAVGNPLGELGGTVTKGIISALDREIAVDKTTMRLLQTDTAINPGNSGGGMFNTSGQLVGIINAKSAGAEIEGLGFAIPIDTAKDVIEDLIGHGYVTGRVDPGFTFVEINDSMKAMMYRVSELGLYISAVEQGSDAAKAGFRSGDYVVSVEGQKVTTEAEANAIIDEKKVGENLTIVVKRNGKEQTLSFALSEYVPSASIGFGGSSLA